MIFGIKTEPGGRKTITADNWRKLVAAYPSKMAASKAEKVSRDWLCRQEGIHGTGWGIDRTPGDCRVESKTTLLSQLEKRYTKEELEALAKGRSTPLVNSARKPVDFSGEVLTIGYCTDTHIGSIYFSENWFASMRNEFIKQKVNITIHSGDVFEGMNTRPGHVFECSHVGYQAQREYGIRLYRKYAMPKKVKEYFIDGNHDRWFTKSNGANIVQDFCEKLGHTYLGQDEGDVILDKYGIVIRAFHGEDGSSYALSYRLQKIIESFSGGEKPHILLAGHAHKALYAPIRNVHCISGGAVSRQSKWMRSKRIENHGGFWVIKVGLAKNDVKWIEPRLYSFYK